MRLLQEVLHELIVFQQDICNRMQCGFHKCCSLQRDFSQSAIEKLRLSKATHKIVLGEVELSIRLSSVYSKLLGYS